MRKWIWIILCVLTVLCILVFVWNRSGVPERASALSQPSTQTTAEPSTKPTTQPTTKPTAQATTQPTTPPTTQPTPPPTTKPPVTKPPAQSTGNTSQSDLVGSLYTRAQLEAIDGQNNGYGPGPSKNGQRPGTALDLESQFGNKYDAHFIAPDNGQVYLTYSLGYEHNNLTAKILDTMAEKGVKGVFFINMHYAKSNPDLVRRMIDEGHIVGNHSSGHYTLAELPIDQVVDEIMSLHEYVKTTYGYEMTYFRPPSGYYSQRVLAIAQSLGYTTVQWSFAYADWDINKQPDVSSARSRLVDSAHSGAIYALHTVSETNATILGDVIDEIRAKGYEFAPLDLWR